ncbi:MAG: SUMF1/EgtB/PvdO family nonheme iron enzyme [bacterium]|nr:SUMF1/EgtB/PvdO family nonheme iron enzyme [bacterium]
MSDETIREDQNATVRENQNATVREEQNAAATLREGQTVTGMGCVGIGSTFQDYRIVRQLPTKGSEADIFVVEKEGTQYILKQYRYGINPKRDILLAIRALSESHPHEFIRLFDADFDAASGRWYEIQEYVANGSLQALMADRSPLTDVQQATFFNDVARELTEALHALHQNNLLHLDLKPSNILLRSVHPLNLVLIDFGIATALDSDMSKKFTQVRGTPMYQSPESYSGGMGRPADWWGLGMILLKIASGAHPFKGLSNNIIAYAIATEPVPVPENLDAGRKELLQGLLTRDPEKRWGYEQVVRWFSGERGIPQHFESTPAANTQPSAGSSALKSIKFMDKPYQSLADLAAAFLKDEQSWEKGREFLMRGYVKQWLEKNDEFDAIVDMDKVMSGTEDPDEKVFRFAQRFGGDVPFAFGGHLITLENLLLFAGKVLKRQPVTAMEQKIADSIENGVLLSYLDFYKQQGQTSKSVQDLRLVLESLKGKPQERIAGFLDFYLRPQNYYCPSLQGNTTIGNIAKYVSSSPDVPVTVEEQERREQERKRREEQARLEQERREQERKRREEQERLEQERREQERRKYEQVRAIAREEQRQKREEQERRALADRERREQQERLEQERRDQERKRRKEQERRERLEQALRELGFASSSGKIWTNSIGMEFVLVPAGTFWMGSADDDEMARLFDREKPRHKVTISRPFCLGKYEVIQAEWEAVMGKRLFGLLGPHNPSHFENPLRPVENVSWNDVQEFIRKLNEKEGHNRYRLPTEAEWEYAARAGSTERYCFGNDENLLEDYAWYDGNSGSETHSVGQKKPNAWGLYDMYGNVWEWVQDWYGDYSAGVVVDPRGPKEGKDRRVLRGGSWGNDARYCRSAYRNYYSPGSRISHIGFRLALSPGH